MPNIISKILHRKNRSSSSSASDLTSPSAPGLVASTNKAGTSTIRLDERYDEHGNLVGGGEDNNRRKSMSAARGRMTSPSAPALARKSLDGRPNGIHVNPVRPAPPPPVPEVGPDQAGTSTGASTSPGRSAHADAHPHPHASRNANAGTVVIDGRADPRQAHNETTAALGSSPRRGGGDDDVDSRAATAGQFDRRGLFDDTPAPSTALDHHFVTPSSASGQPYQHEPEHLNEFNVPPGPVDLDLDRDLPPLPRNPSHEIKEVDSRRRPTMSDAGPRQSIEGELGRHSADAHDREAAGGRLSDARGMDGSIQEEEAVQRPHAAGAAAAAIAGRDLDIPSRDSSLRHGPLKGGERDGRSVRSQATGMSGTTAYCTPAGDSVEDKMAALSVNGDHAATGKGAKSAVGGVSGEDALVAQRMELVGRVVEGSETRRKQRGELSQEGVKTFQAAGMGELVGKESTVDVHTQWLKPVVHETIIHRIHTEYLTVIHRERHRHHVYPKIQPIEDPNPIVLPTLHRIFSPATGKWHEVQGDDAAIAILGEDVFRNGPKEVRYARRPVDEDTLRRESGGVELVPSYIDPSTVLPASVAGKARVVEREGLLGGDMSDWKKVEGGQLFGHSRDPVGVAV